MSFRMFCRIRPDLRWVELFPLNFRHLPDGMLFARCGKQGRREENSEDALANKGSHIALAQLSVSAATRKDESAVVAQASCLRCRRGFQPGDGLQQKCSGGTPERLTSKKPVLLVIERRLHGVTISRGGPHRKTQRMERSVRSRSAFCRHTIVFRADLLYAERYTVVALV